MFQYCVLFGNLAQSIVTEAPANVNQKVGGWGYFMFGADNVPGTLPAPSFFTPVEPLLGTRYTIFRSYRFQIIRCFTPR